MLYKYILVFLLCYECLCYVSAAAHKHSVNNLEREEDGSYSPRDSDHYNNAGHNTEFDHEAILGVWLLLLCFITPTCHNVATAVVVVKPRCSVMSVRIVLIVLMPLILVVTYYYSIGSVKESEEFDRLSPEESKKRLAQLLPQMDLNGDRNIDRLELKKWILNSFRYFISIFIFKSQNFQRSRNNLT